MAVLVEGLSFPIRRDACAPFTAGGIRFWRAAEPRPVLARKLARVGFMTSPYLQGFVTAMGRGGLSFGARGTESVSLLHEEPH
jgi:hypothetical protein